MGIDIYLHTSKVCKILPKSTSNSIAHRHILGKYHVTLPPSSTFFLRSFIRHIDDINIMKRKSEHSIAPVEAKKSKTKASGVPIKTNLLDDSDIDGSGNESEGGVTLEGQELKINADYAKRFEHNKKREELQKCMYATCHLLGSLLTRLVEEKFTKAKPSKSPYGDKYDEDSDSTSEEEDDDGFLATEELDASISKTLQAIRSKDPSVYDPSVTFYAPVEEGNNSSVVGKDKTKPMFLSDYHRQNLLGGNVGEDDEEAMPPPRTFQQEQDDLKKSVVTEMHAAAEQGASDDSDDDFMQAKSKPVRRAKEKRVAPPAKSDVENANKDPETYLSNFMAARGWVAGNGTVIQPFESDDEDDDDRAEQFEAAYNLRFEDPSKSNEALKSYARDIIAEKSVRREETNSRKKAREVQKAKKEAEKAEREDDRHRLRKLKLEEMEEKLKQIKKAAGLRNESLGREEWSRILEDGWDEDTWQATMSKRFGEDYYAADEPISDRDDDDAVERRSKKVKKPKWDDDIDITDLLPDFDDAGDALSDEAESDQDASQAKPKSSKQLKQDRLDAKKAARIDRRQIEALVDDQLDMALPASIQQAPFRYRETSPTSFGLTARDILMAPDAKLNEFAGLKKMATFRDAEKKRKDKKRLGKKARLRQWRKDTFGDEDGPAIEFPSELASRDQSNTATDAVGESGKKKKKKRSRNKAKNGSLSVDV